MKASQLVWVVLCESLLPACSGTVSDGDLGEAESAAQADYFLKIEGVVGETKDSGKISLVAMTIDGFGVASGDAATNCTGGEGKTCQVVPATGTLVSGLEGFDTAVASVWAFDAVLPDGGAISRHVVVRDDQQDPIVWVQGLGSTSGGGSAGWFAMAPASHVTCFPSNCETNPEGYECLPTCVLLGGKIP